MLEHLRTARARATIIDSSASKELSSGVVKTACYLLTKSPTIALPKGKIPTRVWYESVLSDKTADLMVTFVCLTARHTYTYGGGVVRQVFTSEEG